MSKSIIRQIIDLQHKTSAELRELYETLFSEAPHYNATKDYLRPKIAYRMQELAMGGLNADTKDKLKRIADGASLLRCVPIRIYYPAPRFAENGTV